MSSGLIVNGARSGAGNNAPIIADFKNPFMMVDRTKSAHEQAIELTINSITLPFYQLGFAYGVARFRNIEFGFTADYQCVMLYCAPGTPSIITTAMGLNPVWTSVASGQSYLQSGLQNALGGGYAWVGWASWTTAITPIAINGSFTYSSTSPNRWYTPITLTSLSLDSTRGLFWDYSFVTKNSPAAGTQYVPLNNLVSNDYIMIALNNGNGASISNPPPAAYLNVKQSKHADGGYYADVIIEATPTMDHVPYSTFGWWSTSYTDLSIWWYKPRTLAQPSIVGTVVDLYIRAFSNDTRNSYGIPGTVN